MRFLIALRPYLPVVALTLVAILQAVQSVVDGGITLPEWGVLAVAVGAAVTTYFVPAVAKIAPWAKSAAAAYTAGAVVISDALAAGALDPTILIAAVIAVLLSIYGEPAARHEEPVLAA